ncbi:hypothetical protein MRB53_040704 [Persea americana]|nr:hypothetical protein MRB53_040704 [Persea americana]
MPRLYDCRPQRTGLRSSKARIVAMSSIAMCLEDASRNTGRCFQSREQTFAKITWFLCIAALQIYNRGDDITPTDVICVNCAVCPSSIVQNCVPLPMNLTSVTKSPRRQYRSCDRCRKGRRACDAPVARLDPSSPSNSRSGKTVQQHACSRCRRLNKVCTFEWLKSLPQDDRIPRGRGESDPDAHYSQDHAATSKKTFLDGLLQTVDVRRDDVTDTTPRADDLPTTGFGSDALLHYPTGLLMEEQGPTVLTTSVRSDRATPDLLPETADWLARPKHLDLSASDITMRQATFMGVEHSNATARQSNQASIIRASEHQGHMLNLDLSWVENIDTANQPVPEFPEITLPGEAITWPDDQSHAFGSLHRSIDVPDMLWGTPDALRRSNYTKNQHAQSENAAQHLPRLNMNEVSLAGASTKLTISHGLIKTYFATLESAFDCWLDARASPYRDETDMISYSHYSSNLQGDFSTPVNLYNRVRRLDHALSRNGSQRLSRAEDAGSSKALNLAIMAFACQWSQSPQASGRDWNFYDCALKNADFELSHASESPSLSDYDTSDSSDFEWLLRTSVWHASQRCLNRWIYCGSFRAIFAAIIMSCTQQPSDEDNPKSRSASRGHSPILQHKIARIPQRGFLESMGIESIPGVESGDATNTSVMNPGIFNHAPFTSAITADVSLQPLESAIRHLLTWRRLITSSYLQWTRTLRLNLTSIPNGHMISLDTQDLSDFNTLYWLGLMCDTTTSLLHQRPLIIADAETSTVPGLIDASIDTTPITASVDLPYSPDTVPPYQHVNSARSIDIWSSHILDADRVWRNYGLRRNSMSTPLLASQMVKQAVPIEVLLWRKVGQVQSMMAAHGQRLDSPLRRAATENAINEAIGINRYWTENYSGFVAACIEQHSGLSSQVRSWYLGVVVRWNMACLALAQIIDYLDITDMSETPGRSVRASSALTNELRRTSAYAIAEAAQVSNDAITAGGDVGSVHLRSQDQNASNTNLQTTKTVKALEMASIVLLDWLRQWYTPVADEGSQMLIGYTTTLAPKNSHINA